MHYAVHRHTAAELIYERADAEKLHMGLHTWKDAPNGKIKKSDVSVAKNYLTEDEMKSMELIVSAYLDLAENRARRHIPMTMEDWAKRLDIYLQADDLEVLKDAGKISAQLAKCTPKRSLKSTVWCRIGCTRAILIGIWKKVRDNL